MTPDPGAEYWTSAEVAAYLGLKLRTVTAYRHRGQMPAEDGRIGGRPVWRPATITGWRPRVQGAADDAGRQRR